MRTLRRHEAEAQQLGIALGIDQAEEMVFRLAIETGPTGNVERVVFLALRGDEGHTECVWPEQDVSHNREERCSLHIECSLHLKMMAALQINLAAFCNGSAMRRHI
jgi:hypothetical protein